MASLQHMLRAHERYILPVLARAWDMDTDDPEDESLPRSLERLMTDPARMRDVLSALQDRERSALQFLLNQGKRGIMPALNFTLIYGEPRKVGAAQIARENPLTNPANVSEALLYRGLIGFGFENSEQGAQRIVFIPEELTALIMGGSSYQTVYEEEEFDEEVDEDEDDIPAGMPAVPVGTVPVGTVPAAPARPTPPPLTPAAPAPAAAQPVPPSAPAKGKKGTAKTQAAPVVDAPAAVQRIQAVQADSTAPADTSLVDDLTTVLAAISRYEQAADVNVFTWIMTDEFTPFLLTPSQNRMMFVLSIALAMGLIRYHDGRMEINRLDAQKTLPRWLGSPRPEQIRLLAEAWRSTDSYIDLARVPGLRVDMQAGTTDFFPLAARKKILDVLAAQLPDEDWWLIDDLVGYVYTHLRDFQRPNGDYEAWYVYDAANDQPLNGLAHWPQVDGALVRFYIEHPLHWLGMIDLGSDASGHRTARLNAYGRAFIKGGAFPKPPDTAEKLIVEADGRIVAGRRVARADRYQVARFTTWDRIVNGAYVYRLDADGFAAARQQGITLDQMEAFLKNVSGGLPDPVTAFLETWRRGGTSAVTLERLTVLRTTSEEALDALWDDPATRRYFGARLGAMAVIVRGDQADTLRDVLGKRGIKADVIG